MIFFFFFFVWNYVTSLGMSEPSDINHTIYFNEDAKRMLLKLSKDISIHVTLKKNEVLLLQILGGLRFRVV